MNPDLHPDTEARLLAPRLALRGCIRAHLWRDTTRADTLSEAQRASWFPATPLCGISWTLLGDGWEVNEEGRLHPLEARCFVGGPRTRPAQYLSAGGIRCFMTGFSPDAFHALTGLNIAEFTDRSVPLESILGSDWQELTGQMLAAPDARICQDLLEEFLLPRWRCYRPRQDNPTARYSDWMQNLALRALAAGHGDSLRQMERRIKQWTGQSMRLLRRISRSENAFFKVREESAAGDLVWSLLAQDAGYTDQAHLCRETRRVTGFSPEELRRRIETEEAFWPYRIWI